MYKCVFSFIAALSGIPTIAFAGQGSNPPWFPSLMAFEHYDSGRTKLFEHAHFTGSFTRNNVVDVRVSPDEYPTPYKDHETSLSDACTARMQTFAHEPCAQDALTFCKDVESENKRAMVHCLRDHGTELTDACKVRLHEFWARML